MIIDIFSSFDPHNSFINSASPLIFWSICLLPVLFSLSSVWLIQPSPSWLPTEISSIIFQQVSRTQGTNINPLSIFLASLFLLIIIINIAGIIPYLLSASSHLLFTISLGLPLWASLIISAVIYNSNITAANLLPSGAPLWLNPPLILIARHTLPYFS